MFRNLLCALMLPAVMAGCTSAPRGGVYDRPLAANPSAFVAADIGFARLVQDKGQIAAFRELAHPEAVVLTPEVCPAREWLRGQAEPAERMRWQPHRVFISCDGNVGVTQGVWQSGGRQGGYVTLWQRDDKGRLSWRIDQRTESAQVADAPEYIATRQAQCTPRAPVEAPGPGGGVSPDHSLRWSVSPDGAGAQGLVIQLWDGHDMATIIPAVAG